MQLFEIENTGEFMNSLFVKEWLDAMEIVEGEIATFFHIKIDGRRLKGWYDSSEKETAPAGEFITWKEYKQQAFQMIRGKKAPSVFRLVFKMPSQGLVSLTAAAGGELAPEDVQGVYLNIKYEKKQLTLITGISLAKFSMDKSIEREWDDKVKGELVKRGFI